MVYQPENVTKIIVNGIKINEYINALLPIGSDLFCFVPLSSLNSKAMHFNISGPLDTPLIHNPAYQL